MEENNVFNNSLNRELIKPTNFEFKNKKYVIKQSLDDDPDNYIPWSISGLRIYLKPDKVPSFIHFISLIIDDKQDDIILSFTNIDNKGCLKHETYVYSELNNLIYRELLINLRSAAYIDYKKSIISKKMAIESKDKDFNPIHDLKSTTLDTIITAEQVYRILHKLNQVKVNKKDLSLDIIDKVGVLRQYDLTT